MAAVTTRILQEALQLEPSERAHIAHELLVSLDKDDSNETAHQVTLDDEEPDETERQAIERAWVQA